MKKRILLLGILIPLLSLFSYLSYAATYYVATNGSDSNNGSLSTPFATIQKAIDVSVSGSDIIYLRAGTYNQYVNISGKSGITLTRYSTENAYVQGSSSSGTIINIANSSNIIVSYLYVQNKQVNWAVGILVTGAGTNIQIVGNKVNNIHYKSGSYNASDNPGSASVGANPIEIVGDNSNSSLNTILISGNEVYNCMTGWCEGIAVKGNVENFNIELNTVHDITNIGIDAFGLGTFPVLTQNYQSRNGTIQRNTVYNCKCNYTDNGGIYVDGAKDVSIINNKVYNNIYGITLGCENQMNVANGTTSGIHVRNNFVYNNTRAGIMIGTSGDDDGLQGNVAYSDVMGNTFLKNATGDQWAGEIVLQNCNNITFSSNIVYGLYNQMITYNLGTSGIVFNYNDYYYPNGNSGSVVVSQQVNSSSWTGITLSQFQSLVGGDPGSIFANPSMVSDLPSNANFHINTTSPCVNTGNPSYSQIGTELDMDLTTRIVSGRIDMGCDETGGGGGTIAVTGVTMSPTSASITVNATQQLTATVAPSNATNKSVTWSSSNTAIATVSTSGLVTGKAAGTATITVTTVDGGKTATCAVTVTSSSVPVTGVTVSPTSVSLSVNATQQLTATVAPSNATNKSVTWSSSNTTVATVSSGGLVTAKAAGSATITVTTVNGGKTANCAITVTSGGITITINGNLSDWTSINAIATASGQTCTSLKVYDDATYFYFGIAGSGLSANYQLWLNTDNNTATGYNDWNYTSSGADYMVENGMLRKSTGTAWGWTDIGTITASKSSTVAEVRIPRSQLGTLSNIIKVAYSDVNTSWSVVSKLGYSSYTKLRKAVVTNSATAYNKQISVYPNPAIDEIIVELDSNESMHTIKVTGIDGKVLLQRKSNQAREILNASELRVKGMIVIEVSNSECTTQHKVIIK